MATERDSESPDSTPPATPPAPPVWCSGSAAAAYEEEDAADADPGNVSWAEPETDPAQLSWLNGEGGSYFALSRPSSPASSS